MKRPKPVDTASPFPQAPLSLPIPELNDAEWTSLGNASMMLVDMNRGLRAKYDDQLDLSNAIYEMRTRRRSIPWPGAANIALPTVTAATDELVSRVCGAVFQERLFTVSGNDPSSLGYAHGVEQFYNGELTENEWQEPLEACIQLSGRDGTGVAEVLWDISTHQEMRYAEEDATFGDGTPAADALGQPVKRKVPKMITMTDYDAPRIQAVEMRDFIILPNYAPNIHVADGVARKVYMSEADMQKMVNAGIFDPAKVEQIMNFARTGSSELAIDPQGKSTYTISGLITVGDTTVAPPEGIKMMRGPVEMWRVNTNLFDLNKDGAFEENVIWVHDRSRIMAGFAPFEYWAGRPYFPLSLFPRVNRIYGIGVPWRGRGIMEEKNSSHNARLDYMDISTQPMPWKTRNAKIPDESRRWGFDNIIEVMDGSKDIGFVQPPRFPEETIIEEQMLDKEMDRAVGAPTAPAPQPIGGTQQRSARAAQAEMEMRSLQSNTVIRRTRAWLLQIFRYIHALYNQYGESQLETVSRGATGSQRLAIPKEVLALDYALGIVGMGGPLDKQQRRNDMLMLAQFLFQTPLVQGNLQRIWTICRMVVETFDIPEVTALIGDMDAAVKQSESMAKAAEMQQKRDMLMQILSHGAFKPGGKPGGGQPGNAAGGAPAVQAAPASLGAQALG